MALAVNTHIDTSQHTFILSFFINICHHGQISIEMPLKQRLPDLSLNDCAGCGGEALRSWSENLAIFQLGDANIPGASQVQTEGLHPLSK